MNPAGNGGSSERVDPGEGPESSVQHLVADCLERIETFSADAIAAICNEHPEVAERIRREIAALRSAGMFGAPEISPLEASPPPAGDRSSGFEPIGPYQPLKELGRGGQAIVYLAEDLRLHRPVALKILKGFGPLSATVMKRFRREAEVASKLDHPGICPIFDAGVEKGIPYIAMRYVPGETLASRIAAATPSWVSSLSGGATGSSRACDVESVDVGEGAPSGGPSPAAPLEATTRDEIAHILEIIEKTARALHAAHEAGIIHRDIKPGNVIVTPHGDPVILDFGLARDEDGDLASLTLSGEVFGTPAYMSPEQLLAQRVRLDRRTDVYSLGVTLFECLTLRRPFEAPTRDAMYQAIQYKDPPDVRTLNPHIPGDIRVVLETALEKDRDRRYATAEAFAEDLRRVRAHEPIAAKPVGPFGRMLRYAQRRPARATLVAALSLAVPALAALVTAYLTDLPRVEVARLAALAEDKDDLLAEASVMVADFDFKGALDAFQKVASMEGGSPEAVAGMVRAHLYLKQPEAALRVLDANKVLLGDGAGAASLRADAVLALGQTREADGLLKNAPPARSCFDYDVLARRDVERARDHVEGAASRAIANATRAALIAPRPCLSHFIRMAEAALVAKDATSASDTAAVLTARWPSKAVAHSYAGLVLSVVPTNDAADHAISELREAIRIGFSPGSHLEHSTHHNLGTALKRKGSLEEATDEYRVSLELDPGCHWAHSDLGEVFLLRAEHAKDLAARKTLLDEALAASRRAVALRQDVAQHHHRLGNVLGVRGDVDEAIQELQTSIALDPKEATTHEDIGMAYSIKGLRAEALASVRTALGLDPVLPEAHELLGELLDDEGSIGHYREAIRLRPTFVRALVHLGCALQRTGRLDEALEAFQHAAQLQPDAGTHFHLGTVHAQKHDGPSAVAEFRDAVRLAPAVPTYRLELAAALAESNALDEALSECERCLEPDRSFVPGLRTLGELLRRKGRLDQAIDVLKKARELQPADPFTLENLGRALEDQGSVGDAIAAYREVLRVDPARGVVHQRVAILLDEEGLVDEALDHVRQGVSSCPGARGMLGQVLLEKGLVEDALVELKKAVESGADAAFAHTTLGQCLSALGRYREAVDEVRRGREIELPQPARDAESDPALRTAEGFASREAALAPWLAGNAGSDPPAKDIVWFAEMALAKGRPATAARWYRTAIEQESFRAIDAGWTNAVRAAVRASVARTDGENPDAASRARWRQQALAWLQESVRVLRDSETPPAQEPDLRRALRIIRCHVDLAPVRGEAIDSLPKEEQAEWRLLWEAVAEVTKV